MSEPMVMPDVVEAVANRNFMHKGHNYAIGDCVVPAADAPFLASRGLVTVKAKAEPMAPERADKAEPVAAKRKTKGAA